MVIVSRIAHRPKGAAKATPEPVPGHERRVMGLPRNVQHSFIHSDTRVMGDLESVGDVSLEGTVEGNVRCRALTLRAQPVVTGDVHADAVHVCGHFHGTLHARKVVLAKAARMTGDIYYEILVFHEGAEFEGRVQCTSTSPLKPVTGAAAEAIDGATVETGALAGAA